VLVEALTPIIELVAEFAVQLIDALMPAVTEILDALTPLIESLGVELTGALTMLAPLLIDLVTALVPIVPPLLDIFLALTPLIPSLVQLASAVLQFVLPALTQLAPVLGGVAKVVSKVVKVMVDNLVKAFNFLLKIVSKMLNGLIDIYNNTVGRIPGVDNIQNIDLQISVDTNFDQAVVPALEKVKIASIDTNKAIIASVADVNAAAGTSAKKAAKAASEAAKKTAKGLDATMKALVNFSDQTSSMTVKEIGKSFDAIYEGLNEAGKRNVKPLAVAAEKALLKLGKSRDALIKELDKNVEAVEELRDARDELTGSLREAATGLFNIGISTEFGSSIDLIQRSMTNALNVTTEFTKLTASLEKRGIGKNLLDQLYRLGPEAGIASARALSQASDSQLKTLSAQDKQLGKAADKLAAQASKALYDAGIAAAEGLVKGLQSQEAALLKQMDRLADKLVEQIQKKLKIKSPSQRLADEVGMPSGQGVAQGIEAAQGDVNAAMRGMADSMATQVGGMGGPSGGGTLVAEIHATGPTLDDIVAVKIRQHDRQLKSRASTGSTSGTLTRP
jgi:hypothetical protein